MTEHEIFEALFRHAKGSPDPSTQNAACLVKDYNSFFPYAMDCNRFPDGVRETPERWERPLKYTYVEHAERNAIFRAARAGESTSGRSMYACWAACAECARAVVQSGILKLVVYKPMMDGTPDHWKESISIAMDILKEGDVKVCYYNQFVDDVAIRFNGKIWSPPPNKPALAVAFDGVIHRYSDGWKDGSIYDLPVPGVKEALSKLSESYRIVIYSTRNYARQIGGELQPSQVAEMQQWLDLHQIPYDDIHTKLEKPICKLFIDDNAYRFSGDWTKCLSEIEAILRN